MGSPFELVVKVFNPYAPSNQKTTLSACYRSQENVKTRKYVSGGLVSQATTSYNYKRLASLLN